MEPAEFLVHGAAAVADGGHEDVAAEQLAAAETALAVAAVGIDRDGAALERDGDGFARPGIDHIFVNAAHDGDAKRFFLRTLRVARQGGDIGRVIHHVVAEAALRHAHVLERLAHEPEHGQRAAEQERAVGRGVFFDDLARDKAVLARPVGVVGEHMHDFDVRTFGADLIQLILEHDIVRLDRTIEDRQPAAVHLAVGDLLGHGVKRRDAAAAGQRDELGRVAQRLPIERAERQRAREHIADMDVFKEVVRHEVRHVAAHGDLEKRVLAARFVRRGGDRIRPREQALADLQAEVHELAALEHRNVPVRGLEAERFCRRGRIADVRDAQLHLTRV